MTTRKPLFFNFDEGVHQEFNTTTDTVQFAQVALLGIAGVGLDAGGQRITNLPAPTDASEPATKGYTDMAIQGLAQKASAVASAPANVATLSGTMTLDGVPLVVGDRVLLMFQADAKQNGLWVVQSGNWVRPPDFAPGSKAASTYCFVSRGTLFGDNGYSCITDAPNDIVDTNPLMFTQFNGAGQVIPGAGLTKSGNTVSVLLAANPGLQFTSGALDAYLTPAGGLAKDANGIKALLRNVGTATATLSSDTGGLGVLGVPSLFTVAGTATTANVTAQALNTLTMGATTQADDLHTHASVISARVVSDRHTVNGPVTAGDPVAWSSTANTLVRGDASIDAQARIVGLAQSPIAANAAGVIVKQGVLKGVLNGATPGQAFYLGMGGGLTSMMPTGSLLRLVRVGFAVNSTDLDVKVHDLGKRSL